MLREFQCALRGESIRRDSFGDIWGGVKLFPVTNTQETLQLGLRFQRFRSQDRSISV